MKKILLFAIILVLATSGAFYGGMKYQQSKLPAGFGQRLAQAGNTNGLRNQVSGANFVSGEILSKDDKSVTVNGKGNSDGSLTAQSIQIRPAGTNLPSR
jgi:hypothetical protein